MRFCWTHCSKTSVKILEEFLSFKYFKMLDLFYLNLFCVHASCVVVNRETISYLDKCAKWSKSSVALKKTKQIMANLTNRLFSIASWCTSRKLSRAADPLNHSVYALFLFLSFFTCTRAMTHRSPWWNEKSRESYLLKRYFSHYQFFLNSSWSVWVENQQAYKGFKHHCNSSQWLMCTTAAPRFTLPYITVQMSGKYASID